MNNMPRHSVYTHLHSPDKHGKESPLSRKDDRAWKQAKNEKQADAPKKSPYSKIVKTPFSHCITCRKQRTWLDDGGTKGGEATRKGTVE